MASFAESHERLGKPTALAVLASDAISSTAYAGEEILRVLVTVVALAALEGVGAGGPLSGWRGWGKALAGASRAIRGGPGLTLTMQIGRPCPCV